jgi:Flp pilus assembly protein TadG
MAALKRSRQRGATLAEAAVGLMLFFTLILGVLEFSRAFNVYQTIVHAAREGARLSVAPLPGTTTLPSSDQVQQYTRNFLAVSNVTGTTVTVNQTLIGPTVGGVSTVYTQVSISVPYRSFLIPGNTFTMSAQARMRNETN